MPVTNCIRDVLGTYWDVFWTYWLRFWTAVYRAVYPMRIVMVLVVYWDGIGSALEYNVLCLYEWCILLCIGHVFYAPTMSEYAHNTAFWYRPCIWTYFYVFQRIHVLYVYCAVLCCIRCCILECVLDVFSIRVYWMYSACIVLVFLLYLIGVFMTHVLVCIVSVLYVYCTCI